MDMMDSKPAETLRIKNFRGLKDVTIEVGDFTVLIGPQASGKSVIAKLLYYFRGAVGRHTFGIAKSRGDDWIKEFDLRRFRRLFPEYGPSEEPFKIAYYCGDYGIDIFGGETSLEVALSIKYSSYLVGLHSQLRSNLKSEVKAVSKRVKRLRVTSVIETVERHLDAIVCPSVGEMILGVAYFIPAGRSFFATLQDNIFSLLASEANIDPLMVDFGRLYGDARSNWPIDFEIHPEEAALRSRMEHIARGKYVYDEDNDIEHVVSPDGRATPMGFVSSGQQELLPLLTVLWSQFVDPDPEFAELLIVEEPEAHLFPKAQSELVGLLATVGSLNYSKHPARQLITTHSPYILSAVNNLVYAQSVIRKHPDRKEAVVEAMRTQDFIEPEGLRAYMLRDGYAESIIDLETGLIQAEAIDAASEILEIKFDALLDIEFANGGADEDA